MNITRKLTTNIRAWVLNKIISYKMQNALNSAETRTLVREGYQYVHQMLSVEKKQSILFLGLNGN